MNNSLMTLEEVLNATRGKYIGFARNLKNFYFSSVVIDSRNVIDGSLFVPLIGEKQDGHRFVSQAVEKGASVVFVSGTNYSSNENRYMQMVFENYQLVIIVVENTLVALQELAGEYRKKFPKLIRVAVTGSSGKTTTKEMLKTLLSQKYSVVSNKGNLNSETGLPLSVFTIRAQHELALFEMGMNRENEIGELASCFKPQYAIITNIGTAHIGKLGSRDKIAAEKKKVFDYFEDDCVAVIPKDDDYSEFLAKDVNGKIVYYGKDVEGSGVEFVSDDGLSGTRFKVMNFDCKLSLPGEYNYKNILGAIALAKELGLTAAEISEGVNMISSFFGRSEVIIGNKFTIMQDCYNANPDSMEKSIEFCSKLEYSRGKKIFVLGDMLELGDLSAEAHKKIILQAKDSGADFVFLVGMEMASAFSDLGGNAKLGDNFILNMKYSDDDIKEIAKKINEIGARGDFILLKASRAVSLERLGDELQLNEQF